MDDDDLELLDLIGEPMAAPSKQATSPVKKQAAAKRKSSAAASKKPKKKRRGGDSDDDVEDDGSLSAGDSDFSQADSDGGGSSSELSSASSFDLEEELDERQLRGLTEFEREELLAEHAERKQQYLEKMQIKKRLKASKDPSASASSKRSKTRQKNSKKLAELKAKRQRKSGSSDKLALDEDGSSSEDESNYVSKIRSKYSGDGSTSKRDKVDLSCLLGAQVTRDDLERWMFAPFFADTVIGGFVKLGLGVDSNRQQRYRICEIVGVVEYHRVYKVNQTASKKALNLKHGTAEKVFLMDIISNQAFTEGEYSRWFTTMEVEKERLPSVKELERRQQALRDAKEHIFTNGEIEEMVKEKRELVPVPRNPVMEKFKIQSLLEEARSNNRTDDVRHYEEELRNLELIVSNAESVDESQSVWSVLNERNRKFNFEEGGVAETVQRSEKMARLKEGKSLDPSARIKALPTQIITNQAKENPEDPSSPTASVPMTPNSAIGNGPSQPGSRRTSQVGYVSDAFDAGFADIDFDLDD